MRVRGYSSRAMRFRAVLVAGLLLTSSVPRGFPDAFSALPAKDAQRARLLLVRLDASLDAWIDLERRLAAEVQDARDPDSEIEGSKRVKILLEARLRGTWTPGAGPTRTKVREETRSLAGQLESILAPRLDRLDPAALAGLIAEWMPRARRVPGAVPEYLLFAERAAAGGPSGTRFALRALLALDPESLSLRLAPEPGDPAKPASGVPPELEEEAGRIRRIRTAVAALERSSPALGVPELPWSREEGSDVERAARALSLVEPSIRAGILEASGIPGIQVLPAFLAGLSPEDRGEWIRTRNITQGAAEVFLSCVPGALASAPGAPSGDASLPALAALGELEREVARGTAGVSLLRYLTDPTLRLALRSPRAAPSVRTALSDAMIRLAADLEAELARTAAGAAHRVEIVEMPGASGYSAVRAFSVSPDGGRVPVSPDTVRSALARVLPGSAEGTARTVSGPDLGIVVEPERTLAGDSASGGSVPASRLLEILDAPGALSPGSFAARTVLVQDRFHQSARTWGIPPAYVMPVELFRLAKICRERCLGLVGDSEVDRSLEDLGDDPVARRLWETAFSRLEATRLCISTYLGQEAIR